MGLSDVIRLVAWFMARMWLSRIFEDAFRGCGRYALSLEDSAMAARFLTSTDGTRIAYDVTGHRGPVLFRLRCSFGGNVAEKKRVFPVVSSFFHRRR